MAKDFITYLTIYSGTKLPKYYIGSTSLKRFNGGYKGSVQSKAYGKLWKSELKDNSYLFETLIVEKFNTRQEALKFELKLQKIHDVVKNPLFCNMAFAQENGFFGMDNKGKNSPNYGKTGKSCYLPWVLEPKKYKHPMLGRKHSKESKLKMRNSQLGVKRTKDSLVKQSKTMKGVKRSEETKRKISISKLGKLNPSAQSIKVTWVDFKIEYFDCLVDFYNKYNYPKTIGKIKQYSKNDPNWFSTKFKCRIDDYG